MSEQVDLDALIAEARDRANFRPGYGWRSQVRHMADALESTLAELRQERERFATLLIDRDGWKDEGAIALRKHYESQAALSRAEETIEAARAAWWSATEQGDSGLIYTDRIEDAMDEIWNAIGHADYDGDKQKGADRG